MSAQGPVLFLFNSCDTIGSDSEVKFIFGCDDSVVPPNCTEQSAINYGSNTFSFDCGCKYIDYTSNTFVYNCSEETSSACGILWTDSVSGSVNIQCPCEPYSDNSNITLNCNDTTPPGQVYLENIRAHFGFESSTKFVVSINDINSYFGFDSTLLDIQVLDMRIENEQHFGFTAESALAAYKIISSEIEFGFDSLVEDIRVLDLRVENEQHFGFESNVHVSYNPYHNFNRLIESTFGLELFVQDIIVPDLRINNIQYFGFDAQSAVQISALFSGEMEFGVESSSHISYNPYHNFDRVIESEFGFASTANIKYGNPHLSDVPLEAYFGYSSNFELYRYIILDTEFEFGFDSETHILYNPYHNFNRVIESTFGFDSTAHISYNPRHNFNRIIYTSFGFDSEAHISYNPYHNFDRVIESDFGFASTANIKYGNPNISDAPLEAYFGYSSAVDDIEVEVGKYTFSPYSYFGFDSTFDMLYTIGFRANAYFDTYRSRIQYLVIGYSKPTFTATAAFGFELLDNNTRTRYFDLSRTTCCTKMPYELLQFELLDTDDWTAQYGLHRGWALTSTALLSTEQRLASTFGFGYEFRLTDRTVYLGHCTSYFGYSGYNRALTLDINFELGYGNFTTDPNEIKVEMTKPNVVFVNNYYATLGYHNIVKLGIPYALKSTGAIGWQSSFVLTLERLIPIAHFGFYSHAVLNRQARIESENGFGYYNAAIIYEEPYIVPFGFYSEFTIITENYVELFDNGELINEYRFLTPSNDHDTERPYQVSIEGYPYVHQIKGRCY